MYSRCILSVILHGDAHVMYFVDQIMIGGRHSCALIPDGNADDEYGETLDMEVENGLSLIPSTDFVSSICNGDCFAKVVRDAKSEHGLSSSCKMIKSNVARQVCKGSVYYFNHLL